MIISIGEILVDIFQDEDGSISCPGGAPFNVACNIASWDKDAAGFLGCVGNDADGKFLLNEAKKRLQFDYVHELANKPTTQAIVTLDHGERNFRFNRKDAADYQIPLDLVKNLKTPAEIYHFGSLMLSEEIGRQFYFDAISYLKAHHPKAKISFDVNYRDDIYDSAKQAIEIYLSCIKEADIIKFTEEELALLSGQDDVLTALKSLLRKDQMAVVTFGKDGSAFYKDGRLIHQDSVPVKPIDTTGAGDAFYSYFLFALDKGLDIFDEDAIKSTLKRANLVGGCATQKKGAIDVVPSLEEIEAKVASI